MTKSKPYPNPRASREDGLPSEKENLGQMTNLKAKTFNSRRLLKRTCFYSKVIKVDEDLAKTRCNLMDTIPSTSKHHSLALNKETSRRDIGTSLCTCFTNKSQLHLWRKSMSHTSKIVKKNKIVHTFNQSSSYNSSKQYYL